MTSDNINILTWNVRGLNASVRVLVVHETLKTTSAHMVCLQETKLQQIDHALAMFLGAYKFDSFVFKPAQRTKGGVLVLCQAEFVDSNNCDIGRYSISGNATIRHSTTSFRLTTVYGPSRLQEKQAFLQHLRAIKPPDDVM